MPFIFYIVLTYLTVAFFVTVNDWRKGPLFIVIAVALQDPIRKIMPGAPAYLTLSLVPILGAMMISLLSSAPRLWVKFRRHHLWIARAMTIFCITLVIPVLIDLTYGLAGIKLMILGGLSYGTGLLCPVIGFYYGLQRRMVVNLFKIYCVVTSIMLVGVPLDYLDIYPDWLALGTEAMGMQWFRYIPGARVEMFAGFYRSPDVMGWHAIIATMLAISLVVITKQWWSKFLWLSLAAWSTVGIYFCGRRKFFYMLPVFVLVLLWCHRRRLATVLPNYVVIFTILIVLFTSIYGMIGPYEDVSTYYYSTADEAVERTKKHGLDAVLETFRQVGYLGTGLGSAATGAQNLGAISRPHNWQEGGVSRLAVELGLPGLFGALLLMGTLFFRLYKIAMRYGGIRDAYSNLYICFFSVLVASASSFVVSGQIFGDPFVAFFTSFLCGIILSGEIGLAHAQGLVRSQRPRL